MRECWTLLPPCEVYFASFGRNMRTRGLLEVISAGLWQCSSSSFLEEQTGVLLGIYCPPPPAHRTSTGSTGPSPGIMISLDTVLGDKANLLATTHENVPFRRRRPNLGSFRGLCAITGGEGSGKWKTNQQPVRKHAEREKVCGQHLQNHSLVAVNCLSSLHQLIIMITTSEQDRSYPRGVDDRAALWWLKIHHVSRFDQSQPV